jgi:hypothetical protein
MTKLKRQLRSYSRRRVRLTDEEFASLKEVGTGSMQRAIPDEHRDRLIAAGYVREVVGYSASVGIPAGKGVSALVHTGAGLRRLESGK